MGYPPTCLSCQRPFPANSAMVSVPFVRRLAFDPERGRAWRVCADCGEWNLLGTEEAGPVVEEAGRLLAISPTRTVDVGLEEARVRDLELLRIDLAPGEAIDAEVQARQEVVLARQGRLATTAGVLGLATIAWVALSPLVPGAMPVSRILATALPIWSAQLLAQAHRHWRLATGRVKGPLTASILTLVAGLVLGHLVDQRQAAASMLGWPFIVAAMIWIDTGMPVGWTRLRSGRRVIVTRRVLDLTRLWLDAAGRLRVTLPNNTPLDDADGQVLLRDLLDGYSWETDAEAQSAGFQLARGADALPRVLDLLRPALAAEQEGLPLGRLPATWRAALDLALAASGAGPGRLSALAEKARTAQQVSAIAESLDDHNRLP